MLKTEKDFCLAGVYRHRIPYYHHPYPEDVKGIYQSKHELPRKHYLLEQNPASKSIFGRAAAAGLKLMWEVVGIPVEGYIQYAGPVFVRLNGRWKCLDKRETAIEAKKFLDQRAMGRAYAEEVFGKYREAV